jgi:hypothetical protein
MAMTTKRPYVPRKSTPTGAKGTAPTKPASGTAASNKARSVKAGPAKTDSSKAAARILQAAKGPRTISHRKIKEAVDKVFRERPHARA